MRKKPFWLVGGDELEKQVKELETCDPEAMFSLAVCFWESALLLFGYGSEDPGDYPGSSIELCIPAVTCAALSLEQLLKCLIRLEGKKYKKVHLLDGLFKILSPESQDAIRSCCKPMLVPIKKKIPDADFDYCLHYSSKAFERFRYFYENQVGLSNGWLGWPIIECTKERILDLRPEWKSVRFVKFDNVLDV